MPRDYVTVQVRPGARQALQRAKLQVSGHLGELVVTSDVLQALCALAQAHPEEFARLTAEAITSNRE